MKKKPPIPLILDLWAYGCSGSVIAHALGLRNAKVVIRVIHQARSIGDPRAVAHWFRDGRPAGRPERVRAIALKPNVISVHLVKKNMPTCQRGHRRTKQNTRVRLSGKLDCRTCDRIRKRMKQRDNPGYRSKAVSRETVQGEHHG